jgi:hypothetical protein
MTLLLKKRPEESRAAILVALFFHGEVDGCSDGERMRGNDIM